MQNLNNKMVYSKTLPKQIVFFEADGGPSPELLRLGRLNSELYKNRIYLTTIYGKQPFVPTITIFVETEADDKCFIIISIINKETKTTAKQLVIKSQKNNLSLKEMSDIYDEIINVIEADGTDQAINLIKLLNDKDDIDVDFLC